MEKHPSALIEQLQGVHTRQRKLIQQLQADNARLLSDLADVRRERDAFRADAAKYRKENADLQNRFDETLSDYQDLKRERMMLSRSLSANGYGRVGKPTHKPVNNLSVLNEDEGKRPSVEYTEKIRSHSTSPYSHRELPDPLKTESPHPEDSQLHAGGQQRNSGGALAPRTTSVYTIDLDM